MKNKHYTLIEILVIVAIATIVIGMIVPAIQVYWNKNTKHNSLESDRKTPIAEQQYKLFINKEQKDY